ncbi:MAG: hypothetical protein NC408_00805 [Candidatus Gastranaerophilales bacterium]|nr:hypothetical protein [Candidatus Gastranaerophilales bacterium]MCM1072926.1 hypothetical protein [Bacteroides sp.]
MLNVNFRASKQIPYNLTNQARMINSALQEVNPSMQKLNNATRCSGARRAIESLKELVGIECIFKEGGISLKSGDRVINIIAPDSVSLKLRDQNAEKRKDFKYVEINGSNIVESEGFNSRSASVEEFLESILEKIDFPILQLRRFFKRADIVQVLQKISPKAVLSQNDAKTADDIKTLFYEIQERISSVQNGVSRSKIKNAYSHAKPSPHGSKQLEFAGIGVDEKEYSVNIITIAAGQQHLVVKVAKEGKEPQVIIVDPKNRVLKEKNLGKVYKLGSSAVYYTQQEIDSPLFSPKLEVLKRELEAYNEYLKERIAEFNAYKAHYSTGEVGVIDKKTLALIKDLMKQFDGCKAKMLKIKDAPRKRAFKDKYNIETRDGSPSLIFKNINDEGEVLHLSFPTMAGVRCMKIIIEKRNGNIGKSLFVNGDKLVKFNATSLGRSKRTDTDSNYHSQEEIESSGLKEFLLILKKRLAIIPKSE